MKQDINKNSIEKNKAYQTLDSFRLAALLAISGGYMDAYSYLARGGVFANAQTGNMVLLGIGVIQGRILEMYKYLIPIIAFVAGILVAELIQNKYNTLKRTDWRQLVLIIEILAIIVAAFLPIGPMNTAANTLISFVSALQMQSFRHVNGNAFTSTMCTGNLRSGTESLYQYAFKGNKAMKNKWMQYYGINLIFILGAGVGAWATCNWGEYAIFGCCLLLTVAVCKIHQSKQVSGSDKTV